MTWFDSHRDTISHHELKKGVVEKGFHGGALNSLKSRDNPLNSL